MKTFAVILFGKIGDVVNTSVLCREIKHNYPDSRLIFITQIYGVEAAKCIPYVDKVYSYEAKDTDSSMVKVLKQLKNVLDLRLNEKIDCAFVLNDTFRSAMHSRLIGAKKRIGRDADKRGVLLTDKIQHNPDDYKLHISEFYTKLLSPLGIIAENFNLTFDFFEADERYANEFIEEYELVGKKILGINLTTASEDKDWNVEEAYKFVKLVHQNTDYKIVFVGDKFGAEKVTYIKELGITDFIDMTAKTSLTQVAALISKFNKFVTPDTGLAHIAFAQKTPTIVLGLANAMKKIDENTYVWGPKDLTLHKVIYNKNFISADEVYQVLLD